MNINIIITQTTRTARIRDDRLHYHCVDFIVFVFIVEIIDSSTPHALNHLFIGFHEFRCNAYYIYNGHTPFVISVCKYRRDIFIRDFLHFFFFFNSERNTVRINLKKKKIHLAFKNGIGGNVGINRRSIQYLYNNKLNLKKNSVRNDLFRVCVCVRKRNCTPRIGLFGGIRSRDVVFHYVLSLIL